MLIGMQDVYAMFIKQSGDAGHETFAIRAID